VDVPQACPAQGGGEITLEEQLLLSESDGIAGVVRVTRCWHRLLGEPEVEDLDRAFGRDPDISRLQVAVDDAPRVRGLQALGDLMGNLDGLPDRKGPLGEAQMSRSWLK